VCETLVAEFRVTKECDGKGSLKSTGKDKRGRTHKTSDVMVRIRENVTLYTVKKKVECEGMGVGKL